MGPKADEAISTHSKRPRMRDIAEALGVSTGTVDRALHGKSGVNNMTRQRVLSMAETMGYRPNLAARYLVSRRGTRIAVNLPSRSCVFFNDVWSGIAEAAEPFKSSGLTILSRRYLSTDLEAEAFESALDDEIQALIIAPEDPARLKPLIRKAAQRKIPVLCVTTQVSGAELLTSICVDHFASGSIVAELMGRFLPAGGSVLLVTGFLESIDHAEKVRGFRHCAASLVPTLQIAGVIEDHESEEESYEKCRRALTEDASIKGVYVATGNSLPLVRVLQELGLAGKIKVITTDLFPALVPMLQTGIVTATMYQMPFDQGRLALQTLYRFLTENVCPPARIRLAPHIVVRSSVDLFLSPSQHPKRREQESAYMVIGAPK